MTNKNKNIILLVSFLLSLLINGCGDSAGNNPGNNEISFPEVRPSSTTMAPSKAVLIAAASKFGPRDSATLVEFESEIILFWGFYRGYSNYQDVWKSADEGLFWEFMGGNPNPLNNELSNIQYYESNDFPKVYSAIVESQGYIWAVSDTVWNSKDAKSWKKVSDTGPISKSLIGVGAAGHTHIFQIKDYFVFISTQLGEVWKSNNLINWEHLASITDFTPRCGAVVFKVKNVIYIAGGSAAGASGCDYNTPKNDIWYSLDGSTWKEVKTSSGKTIIFPWMPIMWPCIVVDEENVTWLVAGYRPDSNSNLKDIWFSNDLVNWDLLADPTSGDNLGALTFRHAPACLYRESSRSILIAGGKGGVNADNDSASTMNDILRVALPPITAE